MLYLSGAITPMRDDRVGYMLTYKIGQMPPDGYWWAADNGCYPKGDFDIKKHERWLEKALAIAGEKCLFVVVPDIPFDGDGTLRRFHEYKERFGTYGVPLALVIQDGMGTEDIPWRDVSSIFIGGSTEWKMGHEAAAIVSMAKQRGMWTHMGRVNSYKRLAIAASMGCDSVDGTYLKYGPETNWKRLMGWLDKHASQPTMKLQTGAAS